MASHDTDHLRSLMATCVSFLKVNRFDTSEMPNYEDMDNKKFVRDVERKMTDPGKYGLDELYSFMDEVNIEITFRSALSNVYTSLDNPEHHMLVLFYPDDTHRSVTFVKESVKKFLNLMLRLNCQDGVLLSEKQLAPGAKKEFKRCNMESTLSTDVFNVIFYEDGEFFNIIDHISTPKVLKIYRTQEEIDQFVKENDVKLDLSNLSGIECTDTLVKFYRGKIGNIFEFERVVVPNNLMQDTEIVIRIVTPPNEN